MCYLTYLFSDLVTFGLDVHDFIVIVFCIVTSPLGRKKKLLKSKLAERPQAFEFVANTLLRCVPLKTILTNYTLLWENQFHTRPILKI